MNYAYSHKWLIFILVGTVLVLLAPFWDLIFVIKKLSLTNFYDILNQQKDTKNIIKQFATKGVLLLLSSFVGFYLILIAFLYNKSRNYVCLTLLFVAFGGSGYFLSSQKKISFKESSAQFLDLDSDQQSFKGTVKFNFFPKNFEKDLQEIIAGNLRLAINHRVMNVGSQGSYILYNHNKLLPGMLYVLDAEQVKNLIANQKIEFSIHGKNVALQVRDLKGKALDSRNDYLAKDNHLVELNKDKAFFIAFYVLSNNERILRVYV